MKMVGVRCIAAENVFLSFLSEKNEIYRIGSISNPGSDLKMEGFDKILWHRNYDPEMTIYPGQKRIVFNEDDTVYAYFECTDLYNSKIIVEELGIVLEIRASVDKWEIYHDSNRIASILKIPKNQRRKCQENNIEKEIKYNITIDENTKEILFPVILSTPILTF